MYRQKHKLLHYLRFILVLVQLQGSENDDRWLTWHLLVLYNHKSEECCSSLVLKEVGSLLFLQQDSSINEQSCEELLPTASEELQTRSFMLRFQDLVMENTYQVVNRTLKNLKISPSFKPMRNRQNSTKACSSSIVDFGQDGGPINVTSEWRLCDRNRPYLFSGS